MPALKIIREQFRGSPRFMLSCLLFSIFTNDFPFCVKNSKIVLFADDSYLLYSFYPKHQDLAIQEIEEDLRSINEWMIVNRAELNINKTEFMICGPANFLKKYLISIFRLVTQLIIELQKLRFWVLW